MNDDAFDRLARSLTRRGAVSSLLALAAAGAAAPASAGRRRRRRSRNRCDDRSIPCGDACCGPAQICQEGECVPADAYGACLPRGANCLGEIPCCPRLECSALAGFRCALCPVSGCAE